jgi:UDP-glucose 4-epimerase
MTNKILITGGLGYLGGRVSKHLSENTPDYLLLGTRKKHIKTPSWLWNGEVLELNVLDDRLLKDACEGVATIVHFAAINEVDSLQDPENALKVNSLGTLKLLNVAINAGVKRIIYFSTAHVYGDLVGRINEKTIPRPTHPYAITHHVAEDFILAANQSNAIKGIVLRLSNGFGAPERPEVNRWTLIVNDLCKQAVTSRKLVLRSSGMQRRDFITLHDVGRAVEHAMSLSDKSCGDGLFNLGGEASMQILDLANKISLRCEKILGFKPQIIRPSSSKDECSDVLDYQMSKFKTSGFTLNGNFDYEIDETLKMCKEAFSN